MDLILDGPSLYARNYFAATRAREYGGQVLPAAISMATKAVLRLLQPETLDQTVHGMLIAWDARQNPHKERTPKPADYHEARELFQEVLSTLLQPTHVAHPDFEADDLVASAVWGRRGPVTVVSGDKDLMQLHGPEVAYYDLNQKALLSRRFILQKWHVHQPEQIAIALAIIGDPVDNIPGLPKWGPKKTQKLFEAVPRDASFEQALAQVVAQIPESLRDTFWTCLDRTLLDRAIPGVPAPAELTVAPYSMLETLGLDGDPELDRLYGRVCDLYA